MDNDPGRDTKQRLTVAQAADALGLTVDAVRSRIARNTIEHVRESGRVYVLLNSDEYRQGRDQYTDKGSAQDRTTVLIATLRDEIGHLRRESERKDTIIMSLSQANAEQARTIRAIEAPQDSLTGGPGTPVQGEDDADRGNVAAQQHVDEATDTDEVKNRMKDYWTRALEDIYAFLALVVFIFLSFLATVIAAAGDSLPGIISSIGSAFSTAISSGLSAITGDQVVQIVGSIITVVGTIGATYLGIRWRGRNQ